MANVDGSWNTVANTPMGDQQATLTVVSNGDTFTGNYSGGLGSSDVSGTVKGDTLTWDFDISVPMPMTLNCEATVDGDTITGTVTAGAFGAFPLNGTRV